MRESPHRARHAYSITRSSFQRFKHSLGGGFKKRWPSVPSLSIRETSYLSNKSLSHSFGPDHAENAFSLARKNNSEEIQRTAYGCPCCMKFRAIVLHRL